jgi:hypothetical protein
MRYTVAGTTIQCATADAFHDALRTIGVTFEEGICWPRVRHVEHLDHHKAHHNCCPQCNAEHCRSFVDVQPFRYQFVSKYLAWVKPRLAAIRDGVKGGDTVEAHRWHRDFMTALHRRISTHLPNQSGRKHMPDYAKYHLATYGNDWRFLHNL